jgi:ubiquinone biosynthesis protein UbiJ
MITYYILHILYSGLAAIWTVYGEHIVLKLRQRLASSIASQSSSSSSGISPATVSSLTEETSSSSSSGRIEIDAEQFAELNQRMNYLETRMKQLEGDHRTIIVS